MPTSVVTAGWSNPYRYDGRDGVRYDSETGLYWLRVRAYDPALGRFLRHDPLGRAPLYFADQPYVYAGNNPLVNVDPSGQRFGAQQLSIAQIRATIRYVRARMRTAALCNAQCRAMQRKLAYRANVLKRLNHQIDTLDGLDRWLKLARDGAYVIAGIMKLILHATGDRPLNAVLDGADLLSALAGVFHDIGDLGVAWLTQVANVLNSAAQLFAGTISFLRGLLSLPFVGDLVAKTLATLVSVFVPELLGPVGLLLKAAEVTIGGAIADFISAGGHVLDALISSNEYVIERDREIEALPLDAFCNQDGGCPA